MTVTDLAENLPFSSCATHNFVQRECHRFVCPLSKVTIWPRHDNFDPDINYQIQTSRGYASYFYRDRDKLQHEPVYIYQQYSVKESRTKLKVTTFKDSANCHDSLSLKQCREHVIDNQYIKTPMIILPQCQFSCSACNSKWDRIPIPATSNNNDTLIMDININSVAISTNIYVREMFIYSDITGLIDQDYFVSVMNIDQNRNVISIKIVSMVNKYGWQNQLYLIYIIDTIQPINKEIEYDANIVSHTLYQRYQQDTTQYNSIIPINTVLFSDTTNNINGLIKVEVISYFHPSFTECTMKCTTMAQYQITMRVHGDMMWMDVD